MHDQNELANEANVNQDRSLDVAGLCFAGIIAIVLIVAIFTWGVYVGEKNAELPQLVHVPIRSGDVSAEVPCWAVYNYNGVLKAVTAKADHFGALHEFSVTGGPVNAEPMPDPWRWFELSAAFSVEP